VIARAQLRYPLVLTHTGIEVHETWQAPLCWSLSRVADAVIVRSRRMKERLGLADAAIIPSGIDLGLFRPMPQEEARGRLSLDRSRIVLFLGEPRPEKRLDIAEGAVELLRRRGCPVTLLAVSGRLQQEIPLYLNAADVLVLPSDNEGSPGAVKEALACNLPVVATDVGDVADLIHGIPGCFLAERTPLDFAEKIEAVLQRGARADSREAVLSFSWPAVTDKLLDVYEHVLSRHA
jgi:glycosyltransferase involved in cell wall biosynthesis